MIITFKINPEKYMQTNDECVSKANLEGRRIYCDLSGEINGRHIVFGPLLFRENLIVGFFHCVVIDERHFNKT